MQAWERLASGVLLALLVIGGLASATEPSASPGASITGRSEALGPVPTSTPVLRTYDVLADSFIEARNPDRNYGGSESLVVGGDPANSSAYRSVLQFDVAGVPAPAIIVDSTLQLYIAQGATGQTINVHRLRAPWTEGTGQEFGFRQAITVRETSGVPRTREPVDFVFNVPVPLSTYEKADFRVYDDLDVEIPSQIYGVQRSGSNITRVNVVFGATVGAYATRQYYLYFGTSLPFVPAFRTKVLGDPVWTYGLAGSNYAALTAADVDGDGRLEVIFGSANGRVYALRSDGTELWTYTAADVVQYFTTVVDADGDGALDVLFATSGNTDFKIYALDARTGAYKWDTGSNPTKAMYAAAAIADIDGDGIKEIFVGAQDPALYAFNGNNGSMRWRIPLAGPVWGQGAAVGNLTGDPNLEIVYTTTSGDFYLVDRTGSVIWSIRPGSNSALSSPSLGDFENDGDLDIVAGDTAVNGNEFAFRGTDGSTIWRHGSTSDQSGGQVLVDFEDDGNLEVVFSMTRRRAVRALASSGTTVSASWTYTTGGDIWAVPAAADVDLDGVEEILIGSMDGSLYIIKSNGGLLRSFPTPSPITATPIVADLDGDGTMEIVYASRSAVYAISTGSLGHDFRTLAYNQMGTGRFLDGNSPDGAALLSVSLGSVENLGGSGVTWRGRDGVSLWATPGGDFDSTIAGSATVSGSGGWLSWNVTSIVQSWTNGSAPNVGFLLKAANEGLATVTRFYSREGSTAVKARLSVQYLENTAPTIQPEVPNQVRPEDSPLWELDLAGFASDLDTPTNQLRWDLAGATSSLYDFSGGNITGNHRLYFQPKPNAFGNNAVALFLFDDLGNYDSQRLWVNITPVNDGPFFTQYIPTTLYVKYGRPYTFDFAPYIQDIDTPMSGLRLRTDKPLYTSVSGFRVTFSYPENYAGQWDFVVLTVDDGELSDSESITVRLTTDTPPELTQPLPDVTLLEGQSITNVFDLDDYFVDPDGDVLFYSYGNTHVTVTIDDVSAQPRRHAVDMAAQGEWWGVESVTFQARDPIGAIIEDTILVTVLPVNDPPDLLWTPPFVVHYDEPYVFDLTPYVQDSDNDLSEITITTTLPTNVTVSGLVLTMLFPFTYSTAPLIQAPYTLPLTIYATDGLDTTFRVTTVTVGDDYPPQLRPGVQLPDITFSEDEILGNAFDLDDFFIDRDSSTIFYYSGPINVTVVIHATTHSVNFSAKQDWFGAELVTFRAMDDRGAYAEDTMKVTVRPVNDPPYFKPLPAIQSREKTFFFNVRNYTVDVDNLPSQLTIASDSSRVTVQGFLLFFTYPDDVFEDVVNLTISDGSASSSALLRIEIERPNLLMSILPWLVAIGGIAAFLFATRYFRNVVEHVFLIYQGGTPLVHLSRTLTSDKDPDLIASMFTAIQSFMNESFHSMGVGDVRSIEMAEHHVAFGRGQYVLLVVLYRGRESNRFERRVEQVVKDIESKFHDVLADWNGDVDRISGVKQMLERLWGAKDTGHMFRSFRSSPTRPESEVLLRR